MKLAQRAFGKFEMIRQQLGDCKCGLGDTAARVSVGLSDHMIKLVRHQPGQSATVNDFPRLIRFSPQRGAKERVQGPAIDIAKRKNDSVRHRTGGQREGPADGVFEASARFGGTARPSQVNDGGIIVFRATPVDGGILPFHMNRRGLEKVTEFLLHFGRSCGGERRIRGEKDDQGLFTRRDRLRAAYARAYAKHAGKGEDVCNTRHSTHSVIHKI